MKDEFWEQPEVVEQFTNREPDHRLSALVQEFTDPSAVRVLDLGCAAGRNTRMLATAGFDVWALDAAGAMVERTRERLERVLGPERSRERVRAGRMDDLSAFPASFFDLIVALGIYHNARTRGEWERAIDESVRVLKPWGRVLVNHFTPEVDLTGAGVRPIPGERDLFAGFPGGPVVLLDEASLDAELSARGLRPIVPSRTVSVPLERGRRVSVNALYLKTAGEPAG